MKKYETLKNENLNEDTKKEGEMEKRLISKKAIKKYFGKFSKGNKKKKSIWDYYLGR